MGQEKILIVEDQVALREIISDVLVKEGYAYLETGSVPQALNILKQQSIDLVLLDLELDDGHGFTILDFIRRQNDVIPVLIVSTFSDPDLKLESFRKGTDDYIVKPFHPDELALRIKRSLSQYHEVSLGETPPLQEKISIGEAYLDIVSGVLSGTGKVVTLRKKLLDILLLFLQNPDRVISKDEIFNGVWGDVEYDENTVQVHMHQLRKTLHGVAGEGIIETIRGVGYSFHG